MAKKYLGIVLTTRRYDMYRFVVYQYEDTAMVNTCPLCQLLRTIHAYSKEYMEEQREIRGYVPEMSFEPCRIPPTAAFRLMEGVNAANWKKHIWFIDGDVTMLG